MKVEYKLSIEPNGYVMIADIYNCNDEIYQSIKKNVPFSEYDKLVKYTPEELELKAKVEEIVKKAIFQTATDILKEDINKCLEKLNTN